MDILNTFLCRATYVRGQESLDACVIDKTKYKQYDRMCMHYVYQL